MNVFDLKAMAANLSLAADVLADQFPTAELKNNAAGNWAVIVDGMYKGWINLTDGVLHIVLKDTSYEQAAT